MRNICLTFCFFIYFQICFGQLVVTPLYLDQPSSYNPATMGLFEDESIHLSLYSFTGKEDISIPFANFLPRWFPNNLVRLENDFPSAEEATEIHFLSYQRTKKIGSKYRFSTGVQLQLREDYTQKISTPQNFGVSIALHTELRERNSKQRFLSFGLQTNLVHKKINKLAEEEFFTTPFTTWKNSFDDFSEHISKTDLNYVISVNWITIKENKSLSNWAFIHQSDYMNTLDYTTDSVEDSYNLKSYFQTRGYSRLLFNWQIILENRKVQLEFGILIGDQFAYHIGYGRRLDSGNVIRLNLSLHGQRYDYNDLGLKFSFNTAQYNYMLFFGKRGEINFGFASQMNSGFTTQIGAGYVLGKKDKPSLFRLN